MDQEILLIERVESRLIFSDNDEKLAEFVKAFLAPLILKLGSVHEAVKSKILTVLKHVNARVRSVKSVQMPVGILLEMLHEGRQEYENLSGLVKGFVIVYLEMGFERLPDNEIPYRWSKLLEGIAARPKSHQKQLLSVAFKSLVKITNIKEITISLEQPDLNFLFLSACGILNYRTTHKEVFAKQPAEFSAIDIPDGLSLDTMKLVTNDGKALWASSEAALSTLKSVLLRLFSEHPFFEKKEQRLLVIFIATVDLNSSLAEMAKDSLKKEELADFDENKVVKLLFSFYKGKFEANESTKPVGLLLKLKILQFLPKFRASSCDEAVVDVISDCLQSSESNNRLRVQGMTFAYWVARNSNQQLLKLISAKVMPTLRNTATSIDEQNARGDASSIISAMAQSCPDIIIEDDVLVCLFQSLELETSQNIKGTIKDSIMQLKFTYKRLLGEKRIDARNILDLLEHYLHSKDGLLRFCAISYVVDALPSDSSRARYLCFLRMEDSSDAIKKLAETQITLSITDKDSNPGVCDMTSFVMENYLDDLQEKKLSEHSLGRLLAFLFALLMSESNSQTEMYDDQIFCKDPKAAKVEITEWNMNTENQRALHAYLVMVSTCVRKLPLSVSQLLENLLVLKSFLYEEVASYITPNIKDYLTFMSSSNQGIRISAARIYGFLKSYEYEKNANEAYVLFSDDFLKGLKSNELSTEMHQSILIAGGVALGNQTAKTASSSAQLVREWSKLVFDSIESDNAELNLGSFYSVLEFLKHSDFYDYLEDDQKSQLIEKLEVHFKSHKAYNIQECILMTLSLLARRHSSLKQPIFETFCHLIPHLNTNSLWMLSGEAFGFIFTGFSLNAHFIEFSNYSDSIDIDDSDKKILHEIANLSKSSDDSTRKASVSWMLYSIRLFAKTGLQKFLTIFHGCFVKLLTDKDAEVQEMASRGISLVYEHSSTDLKRELINSLMQIYAEGHGPSRKVDSETVLFDKEELGSTPDGTALQTYKSVLTLATDLNQPDLIPKLMNLAREKETWMGRHGAALSFSFMSSKVLSAIFPHLEQLIPKLYRLQFVADRSTHRAMRNIWSSLEISETDIEQKYFDPIVREALESIKSRKWLDRESSCLTLSNLIPRGTFEKFEPHLSETLQISLIIMDDIKETVRKAATSLALVLKDFVLKNSNSEATYSQAKRVNEIATQRFLDGMHSASKEVKSFSLGAICALCKQPGLALSPFIPNLIKSFLENMTAFEPEALNYINFHTDKYNLTEKQLEIGRLAIVKMSPLTEALENSIPKILLDQAKEIATSIAHTIRKGIGLPTRAACAGFIVSLCIKRPDILRQENAADDILVALSGTIQDKHQNLRKLWASAIGHIAQFISLDKMQKFVNHLNKIFTKNLEESDSQQALGEVMFEICKHSHSKISPFSAQLVNIIYYGCYEESSESKSIWLDVWEELFHGRTTVIQNHIEVIFPFLLQRLSSSSWMQRKQAAQALLDTVEYFYEQDRNRKFALELYETVISGLSGQYWKGKEAFVKLMQKLLVSQKKYFVGAPRYIEAYVDRLLIEFNKDNNEYKLVVVNSIGCILDNYSHDKFNIILGKFKGFFEQKENNEPEQLLEAKNLIEEIILCLQKAYQKDIKSQENSIEFIRLLAAVSKDNDKRTVRVKALEALGIVFETVNYQVERQLLLMCLNAVEINYQDSSFPYVRRKALTTLKAIITATKVDDEDIQFLKKHSHTTVERAKHDQDSVSKELALTLFPIA